MAGRLPVQQQEQSGSGPTMRRPVVRLAEVEAEIARALGEPRSSWLSHAPSYLPETVVHLAKHLKQPGDAQLLGKLLEDIVFPKALPIALANCKGLPDADRADIVRELYEKILVAVMNGSPAMADFLEARFGLKVMQWTIDIVRKRIRTKIDTVADDEKNLATYEARAWKEEEREGLFRDFEERLSNEVAQVLKDCPRWVQRAFVQHFIEEIPIESDLPETVTIAKLHGKTGRAVRLWFAKIRDAVKSNIRR
jgi:hypothetical protein